MYTIQNALTTGPTAMNHVPFPHHVSREPHFSPFFSHPYGGIARVIFVSREGFQRFFELDDFEMDWADHTDGKVVDRLLDNHELIGYHINKWSITIIDRTHGALMRHAVRRQVQNPQN